MFSRSQASGEVSTASAVFKLRADLRGAHVHVDVFVASARDRTFAKSGALVFSVGEWQVFGAAMLVAETKMSGHLSVAIEGYLAEAGEPE